VQVAELQQQLTQQQAELAQLQQKLGQQGGGGGGGTQGGGYGGYGGYGGAGNHDEPAPPTSTKQLTHLWGKPSSTSLGVEAAAMPSDGSRLLQQGAGAAKEKLLPILPTGEAPLLPLFGQSPALP